MTACGCNDWHTTQRASMLRRQGQRVPIPRAVLEGATAGISRRDFLRNGAIATDHRVRRLDAVVEPDLGGCGRAGGDAGRRHRPDHRLDLPRRRKRRPEHARARRQPELPGVRPGPELHRPRPERLPDARRSRRHARLQVEPGRDRLAVAVRRRQDGGHPGRRLPAARPEPLPFPRVLAGGRARPQPGDGLAGSLGRPERRRRQPAPGALGRLDAPGIDEERGQPRGGADQPAVGAVRPERACGPTSR